MRTRGFKLFCMLFVASFLGFVAWDLLSSNSSLSVWQRLTRPEDICAYGSCLILPAVLALSGVGAVLLVRSFLDGARADEEGEDTQG